MTRKALASGKETAAVELLERFKVLSAPHLRDFIFANSRAGAASKDEMTRRLLRSLIRSGAVERSRRIEGTNAYAYYLKRRGSLGLMSVPHQFMLADVALAFERAAREHGHRLLTFTTEYLFSRKLIPDAFMVYQYDGTRELHAFIEAETGSTYSRAFSEKVERYIAIHHGSDWQRTLELWPTILVICQAQAQMNLVLRSATTAEPPRSMEFRFATLDDVKDDPLAAIWSIAGKKSLYPLL
jgi:hypothetical protein